MGTQYFLLNFAVKLKLLFKNKVLKNKIKCRCLSPQNPSLLMQNFRGWALAPATVKGPLQTLIHPEV